jgi:hypothetical protein
MKLNRSQTIMFLVRNMALEENKIKRSLMAIQIIDLLKDFETEKYLTDYYQGL